MAFHAIMVLRDEADVIAQTLNHLCEWADEITVLDTGSVDGTWDIVNDLASREPRIHPLESRPLMFTQALRSYVFDIARERMRRGDWFLRADADEFYPVTPPEFIEAHARALDGRVMKRAFDSRLTHSLVDEWFNGPENARLSHSSVRERGMPYIINEYEEPRIYRYRPRMRWPSYAFGPRLAGLPCARRIVVEHYPYRDPVQAAKRVALRQIMQRHRESKGLHGGAHWRRNDWRACIVENDDPGLVGLPELRRVSRDPDASRSDAALHSRRRVRIPAIYPVMAELYDVVPQRRSAQDLFESIPKETDREIREAYDSVDRSLNRTRGVTAESPRG